MPFFDLPTEVRHLVYRQLLVLDVPIHIVNTPEGARTPSGLGTPDGGIDIPRGFLAQSGRQRHGSRVFTTALLCVSRLMNRDTAHLLYSANRFHVPSYRAREKIDKPGWFANGHCMIPHLTLFLDQIGPTNAALVRSICVDFPQNLAFVPCGGPSRNEFIRAWRLVRELCPDLKEVELRYDPRVVGALGSHKDQRIRNVLTWVDSECLQPLPLLERVTVVVTQRVGRVAQLRDKMSALLPSHGEWHLQVYTDKEFELPSPVFLSCIAPSDEDDDEDEELEASVQSTSKTPSALFDLSL